MTADKVKRYRELRCLRNISPGLESLLVFIIPLFDEIGGYKDGVQVYQRKEFKILTS